MSPKLRNTSSVQRAEKTLRNLKEKRKKKSKAKSLIDYYGALKRGIDGMKYQEEMRNEG